MAPFGNLPGSDFVGDVTSGAGDVAGDVKQGIENKSQGAAEGLVGVGEGTINLAQGGADVTGDVGKLGVELTTSAPGATARTVGDWKAVATGDKPWRSAFHDTGRNVVDLAADNPEEWKQSVREKSKEEGIPLSEAHEKIRTQVENNDPLGASGTLVGVGLEEAFVDNPGASVQDASQSALMEAGGYENKDEFKEDIAGGFQNVDDSFKTGIGPFDTATDLLVKDPFDAAATAFTGTDESGESTRASAVELLDAATIGAGWAGKLGKVGAKAAPDLGKAVRNAPRAFDDLLGEANKLPEGRKLTAEPRDATRGASDETTQTATPDETTNTNDAGQFTELIESERAQTPTMGKLGAAIDAAANNRVIKGLADTVDGAADDAGSNNLPVVDNQQRLPDTTGNQVSLSPGGSQTSVAETGNTGLNQVDLGGIGGGSGGSSGLLDDSGGLLDDTSQADTGIDLRGDVQSADRTVGFDLNQQTDEVGDGSLSIGSRNPNTPVESTSSAPEGGGVTIADEVSDGLDDFTQLGDEAGSSTDEFGEAGAQAADDTNVNSLGERINQAVGDRLGRLTGVTDDTGEAGARILGDTGQTGTRTADGTDVDSFFRRLRNEVGNAVDDATPDSFRAGDDAGGAGDDVAETGARASDDGLSSTQLAAGGIGGLLAGLPAGYLVFNALAPGDAGGGGPAPPTDDAAYGFERLSPYTLDVQGTTLKAFALEIIDKEGSQSLGFATVFSSQWLFPDGLDTSQTYTVLSTSGRPTPGNPIAKVSAKNGGETRVPQGRFGSKDQMDQAWEAFVSEYGDSARKSGGGGGGGGSDGRGSGGTNDSGQTNPPPTNANLSGSLDVPDEVPAASAFTAGFTAEATGDFQMTGKTFLAISLPETDSPEAISSSDAQITGGKTTEGEFQVESGILNVSPGDYTVFGIFDSGDQQVTFAESELTVTSATGESESDPKWQDAQKVGEQLAGGWYLFEQQQVNGDEVRYMVAGKNSDDERIYIQPGGSVEGEPAYYPTPEEAAKAHRAWVQRKQNGNVGESGTPSESAGRPSSSGVTRDAKRKDSGSPSASGTLESVVQMARQNPILTAVAVAAIGGGGYYLYREGYFDDAIQKIKNGLGRLDPR